VPENDLTKRRKAEALTQKGSNLSFVGQYAESLPLFDQAIALDPTFARAYNGRAVTLAQLGRPAEGLPSAKEALRLEPANAVAYTTLGLCLYRLGRRDEAEAAYEKALTVAPENPRVLYNYACYWALVGGEEKCREFLTRAFQYVESDIVEHSRKDRDLERYIDAEWFDDLHAAAKTLEEGIAYFLAGRYEAAAAAFEHTLSINDRHVRARVGHSLSLAQLGRANEGLTVAEETVRVNPDYVRGYSAVAICLHRLHRRAEAQTAYERAAELGPDDAGVLYNFACFWAEVGNEEKCREYLTRALRHDDGQVVGHAPKDPDMGRYRETDWFRELIATAKKERRAVQPKEPI
jgi:tetratricopeptide (TPR) repeat protein